MTPCLALDCEFVGIGSDGSEDALARVSLVNFHGAVLYDVHVRPSDFVSDYRTAVSGVTAGQVHGRAAIPFKQAQREVAALLKERILVGHAVQNDLRALLLSHPRQLIRDTSKYKRLCPDRSVTERQQRGGQLERSCRAAGTHCSADATAVSLTFARRSFVSALSLSALFCLSVPVL